MGKKPRLRQERLHEKLAHIRNALGLSQSELLRRLELEEVIDYKRISEYELGNNEPPLLVLLRYARVAGVHMEALVDDELELPDKLPGPVKYGVITRGYASRSRRKK
ncbi:MAG TPA: helix-turn-helix domain-containing protein [Pyrinomonadaceae bacterium]|nr:helix-turn-helix domain-containing protein [Pyrinomonadaceae bacterium]